MVFILKGNPGQVYFLLMIDIQNLSRFLDLSDFNAGAVFL